MGSFNRFHEDERAPSKKEKLLLQRSSVYLIGRQESVNMYTIRGVPSFRNVKAE